MRGEVVGINTLYLEGGDIEWRARRALPGLLVRPSGTLHTDWLIFVFVLVVIIPAHSFKAMGDGSSAAGVVLHAVGVEELSGGLGRKTLDESRKRGRRQFLKCPEIASYTILGYTVS
jgi:hypothetical protein